MYFFREFKAGIAYLQLQLCQKGTGSVIQSLGHTTEPACMIIFVNV